MMLLWANAYAAQNRVESSASGLDEGVHCLQAKDIPISAFLPSQGDGTVLRERMEVLVSRILVDNIPHFQEFYRDVVTWQIPHPYSQEASTRSNLVRLGAFISPLNISRHPISDTQHGCLV